MIKEPKTSFSQWKPWALRDSTTSDDPLFRIPKDFDVSGIYLFAHFKNKKQRENNKDGQLHLNPNVVYIGESKGITRRLESSRHEKIRNEDEYKKLLNDHSLRCLYFSNCYVGWTTWDFKERDLGRVRKAYLLYLERKLIWEFARTYSNVPILNRQ
jgi:hypothetical protein